MGDPGSHGRPSNGCGENFPLDDTGEEIEENPANSSHEQPDRRVELFFFDKDLGILPPPPGLNSPPRGQEYPEWRRRVRETHEFGGEDVGTSSVTVLNRDTNQPIANAQVSISGPSSLAAQTDATGIAQFSTIRPGSYQLEAHAPRFANSATNVLITSGANAQTVLMTRVPTLEIMLLLCSHCGSCSSSRAAGSQRQDATAMPDSNELRAETDRLQEALNQDDISPLVLDAGFKDYSAASKNALVERAARGFAPAPSAKLLARLLFIRTPDNEPAMRAAYVANLRSSEDRARAHSLYGLQKLGHDKLADLALLSLRDTADPVVSAAITILLPQTKSDARLHDFLSSLYLARRSDPAFHASTSLLEANGFVTSSDKGTR